VTSTHLIGIAASVFTSATLLPQLVKIVKEKNADGTSYGMLGVLFVGLSLWIIYGVRKEDLIIIIANAFSLLLNLVVLILTFRYRKKPG
jgi:MtN3 and saliva related transmembrane protein